MNAIATQEQILIGDTRTLRRMLKHEMEALMNGTASVQHAVALGCLARQYLQTIDLQLKVSAFRQNVIEAVPIDEP